MHDISRRFKRDLAGVSVVGDSLRDLQAGEAVAADLWLLKTGKRPRTLQAAQADADKQLPKGTRIAENLAEAVDQILVAAAGAST